VRDTPTPATASWRTRRLRWWRAGCFGRRGSYGRTHARGPSARAQGEECRPGHTNSPPQTRPEPLLGAYPPKRIAAADVRSSDRYQLLVAAGFPTPGHLAVLPLTRSVRAHRVYTLGRRCQCSHDGNMVCGRPPALPEPPPPGVPGAGGEGEQGPEARSGLVLIPASVRPQVSAYSGFSAYTLKCTHPRPP